MEGDSQRAPVRSNRVTVARGVQATGSAVTVFTNSHTLRNLVLTDINLLGNTSGGNGYVLVAVSGGGIFFTFNYTSATPFNTGQWKGHLVLAPGDSITVQAGGANCAFDMAGYWEPFVY